MPFPFSCLREQPQVIFLQQVGTFALTLIITSLASLYHDESIQIGNTRSDADVHSMNSHPSRSTAKFELYFNFHTKIGYKKIECFNFTISSGMANAESRSKTPIQLNQLITYPFC